MKKLIFLLGLFCPLSIFSQDTDSTVCSKIITNVDKFDKNTTFIFLDLQIDLMKSYYNKDSFYIISLREITDKVRGLNGLRFLLSNEELVASSKARIKYEVLKSGLIEMSANMDLSILDLKSMVLYEITDAEIGGKRVSIKNGKQLKEGLKCLIEKHR